MRLEAVTAKIRPRARWESIDIGCAMARRSYVTIFLSWLICVWPLWVLGIVGLGEIMGGGWHVFCSFVWVWFTLGVASKLPLYVISRELFGERVAVWGVVKLWPRMLFSHFWRGFWRRFSFNRSLSLPVSELEGLRGHAYKARVQLLVRNGGDGAVQAALVSFLLVIVTMLACVFFLMMVFQLYGENDLLERFFEDLFSYGDDYAVVWMLLLFYVIALSVIEPLYTGAGFAMYVNSRTLTEGWDIELSFKRLSERLNSSFASKGSLLLFFCLGFSFLSVGDVRAETAKERVERITSAEDYIIHQRTEVEYKRTSSSASSSCSGSSHGGGLSSGSSGPGLSMFQGASLFIFVALIVLVVGVIIWVIVKNRHATNMTNSMKDEDVRPAVKSVMGMDVTPESLPKALSEEARDAWLRGDHQLALSLLYRGAISWMVNRGGVPIVESDTEDDCVRRVMSNRIEDGKDLFFRDLTDVWVGLAYGKKLPQDSRVIGMCDRWPFDLEGRVR